TRAAYANDVEVVIAYPPAWVERVERGDVDSAETEASVREVIQPLLDAGVDEIALGCTHYPFLAPLIQKVAGARVTVLDPSDAVARQTARVLSEHQLLNRQERAGEKVYYTSGDVNEFARVLENLMGEPGKIFAAPLLGRQDV